MGRRVLYEGPDKPVEIVGMVADARFASLRDQAPPTIYFPYRQRRQHRMSFAARVSGEPTAVAEAVRRAVAGIDSDVPLFGVRSQVEQIDWAVRQERVFAWLASGFGLLALVLACLGIYGTLGYGVARRRPEIGVRMALGATRRDVVSLVLRESLTPVVVGVAIGIGLALATTRMVQTSCSTSRRAIPQRSPGRPSCSWPPPSSPPGSRRAGRRASTRSRRCVANRRGCEEAGCE